MKQIIPCALLVCSLLAMAGCQVQVPVCTEAIAPSVTAEPTQGQPMTVPTKPITETAPVKETEPEETTAAPNLPTEPPETDPTPTEPEASEPQSTAPPSTEHPATEPPVTETPATEATATEPPATVPPATAPPETTAPASEPPAVEELPQLDCQEAMDIGNSHGAASYGWTVDPSLNETNAGFHFGSWVFLQDGQERLNAEALGQVDFLYREMKRLYPDQDSSVLRFRVHAFICPDGTYEVRVYYA